MLKRIKFLDGPVADQVIDHQFDDATLESIELDGTALFETNISDLSHALTYRLGEVVEFSERSELGFIHSHQREAYLAFWEFDSLQEAYRDRFLSTYNELFPERTRRYIAPKPHFLNDTDRYIAWSRMKHDPGFKLLHDESNSLGIDPKRIEFE